MSFCPLVYLIPLPLGTDQHCQFLVAAMIVSLVLCMCDGKNFLLTCHVKGIQIG